MRASAFLSRCDAYAFKGQLDQALADCGKAIQHNRNEAQAHAMRGRILFLERAYDLALRDLGEAIRLQPHETGFLSGRAGVYDAAGRPERAIEDYAR